MRVNPARLAPSLTYSGGLGILAGDTIRSAADLGVPLVAVSLVSRAGYFRQQIDAQGRQVELPASWDPSHSTQPLDAKIALTIEGRPVWVGAWLYVHAGLPGSREPVILLDTDLPENRAEDREITHYLYGGDDAYRLKQEIVLGMGGVRMLHALGFRIRQHHMNEGHSALLGVELLRRYAYPKEDVRSGESPYNIPQVRELYTFTTHTPVEAGHDRFGYGLVERVLGPVIDWVAKAFGRRGRAQHDAPRAQSERIRERGRQAPCRGVATALSGLRGACCHERGAPAHLDL